MRAADFIIIGAMKCATSTLHEQLARQPGLFMSTPKEPNFFSDDPVWNRGTSWYAQLFQAAPPEFLCGESSTHYTKLPTYPQVIDRIERTLPATTKFIYIMRHPVERLVSQYIHEWTQRVIAVPIDSALGRHPELIAYSRYAMQIEPWLDRFGTQRVLPVFYERLTRHPQLEIERIGRFLGCRYSLRWDEHLKEQNVSAQRMRASWLRDAVVNLPGCRALRRALVPTTLRDRIKSLWTMRNRPELSATSLAHLHGIFDDDLSRLNEWLGTSLTCRTFKAEAVSLEPAWRRVSRTVAA